MRGKPSSFILKLHKFDHVSTNGILFTLLILLSPHATAQTHPLQPQSTPPPPPSYHPHHPTIKVSPSMAIVVGCFVTVFVIMGCISVYVRQCAERRMMGHRFPLSPPHGSSLWSRRRGLDPNVIAATFPTFLYSDVKGHKIGEGVLECAVCLNEFEDDENLRLLPNCSHVFHKVCIDSWLAGHVTCPVCRANLVPKPGEVSEIIRFNLDHLNNVSPNTDTFINNESVHVVNDLSTDMETSGINVIKPCPTPCQNRQPRSTQWKPRGGFGNFRRSHSTGHSLVQHGDDFERFTLRLPEEVRSRLVSPSLSRTNSNVVFPRARSSRNGYRSTSVRTNGEKFYERFDIERRLGRWGISLTPNQSPKFGGGDDMTGTPKRWLRSVKSPFDRLFGGRDKDNVVEQSIV